MQRLVIVGASLAGLRAAQAARAAGFAGSLVVIGDEPHLPYTRPPLSKELLAGVHTPEQTAFPCNLELEWRLGETAIGLDREAHTVQLESGTVAYDRLIVATGSRARTMAGALTIRTLDDALALRERFETARSIAIIGAGFIGCEVAATARKRGLDVTLYDIADQVMTPLGRELGALCADLHREHGVDLRLGAPAGDVDADIVLAGLGALPNTEWLTGLTTDPGVVCDATLTSVDDPDILAAGDVVSWPHPLAGGERIRVEHWTTAAEHGQLAGRNALLAPEERSSHVAPPYFWSDQYDVKIQAVGLPGRAVSLDIVERDGRKLVATGADEHGRLVAAVAFNSAKRLGQYRRQLVDPPVLGDPRSDLHAEVDTPRRSRPRPQSANV
jgi:NADPH-dependent 2,4-dienoyl-CoA reductase/sulfur reductase-like enzyme